CGRVVDVDLFAVAQVDLVLDGRRRRDQIQAKLTLEPLLDDLHVQQAEEAAPKAEAEGSRALRLVDEGSIITLQRLQRLLQLLAIVRVARKEAGEDHRLHRPVTRQRRLRSMNRVGDGVPHARVRYVLDGSGEIPDLTG